jgi:hypothetical protein
MENNDSMTCVAQFRKNKSDVVRVEYGNYLGHVVADMRVWERDFDGELHRSKRGLTLRIEQLPDLLKGLTEVMAAGGARETFEAD